MRQKWSPVTSSGKGDNSCDLNEYTVRGHFQRGPVLDTILNCLNIIYSLPVIILEPILRHNYLLRVWKILFFLRYVFLPALVASALSLNSTLSLLGLDCWPAIPLIKVALFIPAAFLWGEKRPWTSTFVAFSRINSPCPLKVNDRPSRVVRWGSPRAPPL